MPLSDDIRKLAEAMGLSPENINKVERNNDASIAHRDELFKYAREIMGLEAQAVIFTAAEVIALALVEDIPKSPMLLAKIETISTITQIIGLKIRDIVVSNMIKNSE